MTAVAHPPETNSGVVTSWLPVTSAWFSVSQCSSAIYSQGDFAGALAIAFDPFYGLSIDNSITCLPPAVTSWWNQAQQTPVQTVTSLGPLVCPSLYTTATTSVLNSLSTFIACCPSSYNFQKVLTIGQPGECNSPLTSGQSFKYMSTDLAAATWGAASTIIASVSGASVFAIPVNGYIFASTSNRASSAPTATPATSSSLPPASSSATLVANTGDLSSGAKAGIAVGVILAVIGVCCLLGAIFIVRRRRRESISGAPNGFTASKTPLTSTELDSWTPNGYSASKASPTPAELGTWTPNNIKHQMGNEQVFEMGATPRIHR